MAINHWEPGSGDYWSSDAAWSLGHKPLATEDVTFDGGDTSSCEVDENSVALSVTISDGYTGAFEVKTTVTLNIGGSFTSDATFTITNYGTIEGNVDFGAATPTWEGDGVITVDEDGTLDLGTDADNDQAVDVQADVTIGDHFRCDSFTGTSGEITGAGKTITVGSGGLTNGGATLDAVGTLNIIVAETPAAFDWAAANSNHSLGTLTVNAATTMTGTVFTTKVAGSATIAIDSVLYVRAMAADFWTNTATHSGSSRVIMYAYSGSHANTALINIGTCEFQVDGGNGATTTLTGGLTCGVLDLNATAQNLVVNGPLSASGNTTLDDATLTLGSAATHSFGGTITSGSTGILIIDGTTTIAGNVTTTGIAVTVKTGSSTTLSGTAVWDNDGATEFEAGVTLFSVYGFDGSSGVITGGGNAITIGVGGLDYGAATLDAAGTLNFIVAETPTALSWNSFANRIGTLTLNADAGTTGGVQCEVFAGTGAITTNNVFQVVVGASNFWTNTAAHVNGGNAVKFYAGGSYSNATLIDIGDVPCTLAGGAYTTKLTGGLTCAALTLDGTGAHTLDIDGGNLTCTTISFDENLGAVKLGEGDATITGAIGLVAAETGCSFDFETSKTTLGDDVTGAGIVWDFGESRIYLEKSTALTMALASNGGVANRRCRMYARHARPVLTGFDTNWTAGDPPIRLWPSHATLTNNAHVIAGTPSGYRRCRKTGHYSLTKSLVGR